MRQQKIRGQKRRHKQIEKWRLKNLDLRLDLIEKYNRDYIDIIVHPWCDISILNSKIPYPKGKTKKLILNGLIDIYESLKVQLDRLGKPYYLNIWLFEPRFSNSQVVCAIADKIDYYENIFYKPDFKKEFKSSNYGQLLSERLKKFDWDYQLDEDHYDNSEFENPDLYSTLQDFEETKIWFKKLLRNSYRLTKFDNPIEKTTELYSFKKGDIWVLNLKDII